MSFAPEKEIVDILQTKMSLPDSYGTYQGQVIPSIVIGSQNALLGKTDKLQIIVQSLNDRVIHNYTKFQTNSSTGNYEEVNEQIIFSTIQVDIQSKNNDARDRRSEILYALTSVYSQDKQTTDGFRIFSLPTAFINNGDIQGGSALNRWTIRFNMTYKQTHTGVIDYYDKFSASIDSEKEKSTIYFYDNE